MHVPAGIQKAFQSHFFLDPDSKAAIMPFFLFDVIINTVILSLNNKQLLPAGGGWLFL